MSLFCWTQRKIFWRMWESEQFWGTIDFHSIFFPTMEVNGAPKQPGYKRSSKYLPLCSAEQRNWYRFGSTWGWVNDDRIFIFGWTIPLSVERSERHHQLQDTIPQHCGESTTGRRSEWVLLQVWKKHHSHLLQPPLSPLLHYRSGKMMCVRSSREKEGTRPRRCDTSLFENLRWPVGPHLHTDHWSCAKSPQASNAPPSSPSQRNPKLLVLITTGLWL